MTAAIYTRVSTRDKGQDTDNQLRQLREFCLTQEWTIVHEYEDYESGGKAGRAQFKAMMAEAGQRKFDVLLFWALDRLSREGVYETHTYLKRLDDAGVRFRSFTEPYLDSCGMFRDALISILAVIAKQERVRISERVRAGLDRARATVLRRVDRSGVRTLCSGGTKQFSCGKQGCSWRKIARQLGVSAASIRRACQDS